MKKCTWCAKEYTDGASVCAVDGNPLETILPPLPQGDENLVNRGASSFTREARRGRSLLLVAFAIILASDLCVIVTKVARLGLSLSGGSIIRWGITAALFYAIWRGKNWVRWLVVALMSLGLLLVIPSMRSREGGYRVTPLGFVVVFQLCSTVALLAFPPSVSAFIKYQREKGPGH